MQIRISLKFSDGDFHQGFGLQKKLVLVVSNEDKSTEIEIKLPPAPEIPVLYQKWKDSYIKLANPQLARIKVKQVTSFSYPERHQECEKIAQELRNKLNQWLSNIKPELEAVIKLNADSEIIFCVYTQDIKCQSTKDILYRLPWREWDYFSQVYYLEAALCFNKSQSNRNNTIKRQEIFRRVRITSIFGESEGINIQVDRELIEKLSQRGAELLVLSQPKRPDFIKLWDEPCDILFYSGHSYSEEHSQVGFLQINQWESLNLEEIKNTLREAIKKGLKIAFFNSCDGLGLAQQLADLNLSLIIVWRELVPDKIAQRFLEYFLNSYAEGKSLFTSMRDARMKLVELAPRSEKEKQLPGVKWLPIICQNTIDTPPTWEDLGGLKGKLIQSPYRGLSPFYESDKDLFFGRNNFIRDLVKGVNDKPLVPIIGASGSGKSSAVFAGLVPQLRNISNLDIVSFRPGKNPFDALALALSSCYHFLSKKSSQQGKKLKLQTNLYDDNKKFGRLIDSIINHFSLQRFVLIADQFEEIYTLTKEEYRQPFLDALLYAIEFIPRFTLVLTLRADFYGHALSYRPLSDALQSSGIYNLAPMNSQELRAAIEKPAHKMKVELESGLTTKLIDDLGTKPGRLPLLEFTLSLLWDKHEKWYLTHQAYQEIGGLEKALAQYADSVLNLLSRVEKKQAEQIFIQLISPGEGTEDTKRVATYIEVGASNWNLVKLLADKRLVITGWDESNQQETVEIIHEALIREWGNLRLWIEGNREFRIWQERLKFDVREWENKNYLEKALLQGTRLAIAENWFEQRQDELTSLEKNYISASVRVRDKQQRKQKLTRQLTISGLVGGLVLVSTFAGISEIGKTNAEAGKISSAAENFYSRNDYESALVEAINAGRLIKKSIWKPWIATETKMQVISTLQQAVFGYQINELKGHLSEINSVSFSPDSTKIASASSDKTINIWDGHTGEKITTFLGHADAVNDISFSTNGKIIVSASDDQTIKLWNVATGEEIKTLKGHVSRVITISFSPDGKTIASGSGDGMIKLWNARTGAEIKTLSSHSSRVLSVSFSPDGKTIVSGSGEGTIKLWNINTGLKIKTLEGHKSRVSDVNFSPDGKTIVSGSGDYSLKLWDFTSGRKVRTLNKHVGAVNSVKFSPDGKTIASASDDYSLKLWNTKTLDDTKTFKVDSGRIISSDFSTDGKKIASGLSDGTLKISNVDKRDTLKKIKTFEKHSDEVISTSFSPDGKAIASGSRGGTLKVCNSGTGKDIHTLQGHSSDIKSFSLSPNGKVIASGNSFGEINIWDSATGKEIRILKGNFGSVKHLSFSPDSKIIASGSENGTIKLWNLATGEEFKSFKAHINEIKNISFSSNGKILASSSNDSQIKLWNLATGEQINTLKVDSSKIINARFSPTENIIAAGLSDGTIKLWNPETGEEIQTLKAHSRRVTQISFSPNGKIILSGSENGTIKVWDTLTGKRITTLAGDSRRISSLSFSPKNKIIASGSTDRMVRLWDINTGKKIQVLGGHFGTIKGINFFPDGQNIISASRDGTVKLRDVATGGKVKHITLRSSSIRDIDYSNDGKIIASASADRTVRLWDNQTGKQLQTLKHSSEVNTVSFSPKNQIIASGSDDNTVNLWNAVTGEKIKTLKQHSSRVNTVKFSPDGKIIASGSKDGTIILSDTRTGKKIYTLKGHLGEVKNISFSPNGKIIASASADKTIKLWESNTGKEIRTLRGHSDKVISVIFSPDGKIIASGSADRKLRLWIASTGREIKALRGNNKWVRSLSFSPDGKTITSASAGGKVILWNFDLDSLLSEGCNLMRDYLQNNLDITENEKRMCDSI